MASLSFPWIVGLQAKVTRIGKARKPSKASGTAAEEAYLAEHGPMSLASLQDARCGLVKDGAKLEKAILRNARELMAWREAHPWECSAEGKRWYLENTVWGEHVKAIEARGEESMSDAG